MHRIPRFVAFGLTLMLGFSFMSAPSSGYVYLLSPPSITTDQASYIPSDNVTFTAVWNIYTVEAVNISIFVFDTSPEGFLNILAISDAALFYFPCPIANGTTIYSNSVGALDLLASSATNQTNFYFLLVFSQGTTLLHKIQCCILIDKFVPQLFFSPADLNGTADTNVTIAGQIAAEEDGGALYPASTLSLQIYANTTFILEKSLEITANGNFTIKIMASDLGIGNYTLNLSLPETLTFQPKNFALDLLINPPISPPEGSDPEQETPEEPDTEPEIPADKLPPANYEKMTDESSDQQTNTTPNDDTLARLGSWVTDSPMIAGLGMVGVAGLSGFLIRRRIRK